MSDLSRRAVVAALPAIALPAVPTIAAEFAPVSNVAVLADMERTLARILVDLDKAYERNLAAFRRFNAARRGWQVPFPADRSPRGQYEHERRLWRWRARLARLREECGQAATEARIDELREQRDAVCERGWHVQATDLTGLKIKARMGEHANQMLGSLAADLRAMA